MGTFRKWWRAKFLPWWQKYRQILLLTAMLIGFMIYLPLSTPDQHQPPTVPITTLQSDIAAQRVKQVTISNEHNDATVELKDGHKYLFAYPTDYGDDLMIRLEGAHIPAKVVGKGFFERYQSALTIMGLAFIALMLLIGTGGIRGLSLRGSSLRSSGVVIAAAERPKERFDDVGGADEIIAFFRQDVHALQHPERYAAFGVKANEGTILYGPPGTGKTLLARAIAGEAGVPFFALKGSDFLGRWLNDGPRAVREVFEQARRQGPSIVFIDEFDSIASKRSGNEDSGSKELNNTVNELLAQLDGFGKGGTPVLVIAATNRMEDLDPGILRPGRFTRHAEMPRPDKRARLKILRVHTQPPITLADEVDLERVARLSSGMSGAELAAIVNQAGLATLMADENATEVPMEQFMEALATAQIGIARKSREVAERDRRITAMHEGGHAITALFTPDAPVPTRVTIIPRGPSGGHTGMDEGDWLYLTKGQLRARLTVAMAGRAAEKLLMNGDFTTGAEADIERATKIATYMVCKVGMGGKYTAQVPLGPAGHDPRVAEVTDEIDKLVAEAEDKAMAVLRDHLPELEALRDQLLDVETIDGDALAAQYAPSVA